jgi:hypothetical protein
MVSGHKVMCVLACIASSYNQSIGNLGLACNHDCPRQTLALYSIACRLQIVVAQLVAIN